MNDTVWSYTFNNQWPKRVVCVSHCSHLTVTTTSYQDTTTQLCQFTGGHRSLWRGKLHHPTEIMDPCGGVLFPLASMSSKLTGKDLQRSMLTEEWLAEHFESTGTLDLLAKSWVLYHQEAQYNLANLLGTQKKIILHQSKDKVPPDDSQETVTSCSIIWASCHCLALEILRHIMFYNSLSKKTWIMTLKPQIAT